jgi:hypothetical protein
VLLDVAALPCHGPRGGSATMMRADRQLDGLTHPPVDALDRTNPHSPEPICKSEQSLDNGPTPRSKPSDGTGSSPRMHSTIAFDRTTVLAVARTERGPSRAAVPARFLLRRIGGLRTVRIDSLTLYVFREAGDTRRLVLHGLREPGQRGIVLADVV